MFSKSLDFCVNSHFLASLTVVRSLVPSYSSTTNHYNNDKDNSLLLSHSPIASLAKWTGVLKAHRILTYCSVNLICCKPSSPAGWSQNMHMASFRLTTVSWVKRVCILCELYFSASFSFSLPSFVWLNFKLCQHSWCLIIVASIPSPSSILSTLITNGISPREWNSIKCFANDL